MQERIKNKTNAVRIYNNTSVEVPKLQQLRLLFSHFIILLFYAKYKSSCEKSFEWIKVYQLE